MVPILLGHPVDELTTLNNKVLRILQNKWRCCNDCFHQPASTQAV